MNQATITIEKNKQEITRDIVYSPDDLTNIKRVLGKGKDPDGWKIKLTKIHDKKLGL